MLLSIVTAATRPCARIAENLTCGAMDAAMWTPKPSALPAPMIFRSTRGAAKDRRLKTIGSAQKMLRIFLSQGGVMKELDEETLLPFDGRDGRPCYIAHGDRVIDVSSSKLWKTGTHMKRHQAGGDLTLAIGAAPHGTDVLDKFPQVGILKKKAAESFLPAPLEALMERVPFLRRHPHPMVVHFPMVFSMAPVFFYLLYLLIGERSFEATALHCLAADILFIVPSIATGFLTWWVNYQAKPMKPVRIKIYASFILLAVATTAFLWRVLCPEAFTSFGTEAIIYFVLLLSMAVLVSIIGYFGGSLTFPAEKK